MVVILFTICASICYYSYHHTRLRMLSPTFWSSLMFAVFAFIYMLTFFDMNSDASIETILVITGFLLVTLVGERIGTSIQVKISGHGNNISENLSASQYIYISKWKVILLSIVFMVVAVDRFKNLSAFVSQYAGGYSGIMGMMEAARIAFIRYNTRIVLSSTLFNQLIYCCEICTYIFIYIFIHNLVNFRKKNYYLLLILVPDLVLRFLSTSRTSFMILLMAIIGSYFCVIQKKRDLRKLHISPKVYIGIGIFSIAFIIYGRVRNNASSIPLMNYLQMYTCCSIYGLNYKLVNGWDANPYFGFNTMQHIYELIGVEHDVSLTWNEMLVFNKLGSHSNVYTSLMAPISDFSIGGMLIVRLIVAIISSYILIRFLRGNTNKWNYLVLIYYAIIVLYCYMYSATGDVFIDLYLNPGLMIRYLIYSVILIKFFLRPKYVACFT